MAKTRHEEFGLTNEDVLEIYETMSWPDELMSECGY